MVDTINRRDGQLPLSSHDIDTALQMMNSEEYETLAEFLGNSLTNKGGYELLTLLSRIAATCHLLNKSAVWHEQVSEQAYRQVDEAVAVLRDLLQLLRDGDWDNLALQVDEQVSPQEMFSPNGHVPQSLWERIKNLFTGNGTAPADTFHAPIFTEIHPYLSDAGKPPSAPEKTHTRPPNNPLSVSSEKQQDETQTLLVYGLGVFGVYHQGKIISDWATRKSKSLFKYLLMNREKPVPKEILMEVFWPDSDETAARNNLNVTIYNLRQVLSNSDNTMSYVLYQDDCYYLNPDLLIWFDYEVFNQHYQRGVCLHQQAQFEEAVRQFQTAELVYRGELFEEDRYDDWLLPRRESAHNHYVQVLAHLAKHAYEREQYMECINLCLKLLGVDDCLEDSYRLLMQSYMKQGQNHLAMRQYYTCIQTLEDELGVLPSQDTVALYEQICTTITRG